MATQTYDPIASITLGAAASTVTFSAIPQTYTDLILVSQVDFDSEGNLSFRLNSDSGSNYSYTYLSGSGSTASSARGSSQSVGLCTAVAAFTTTLGDSVSITHFMNYSNTTTNKTVISRANTASLGAAIVVSLWRSTSAVTSISLAKDLSFTTGLQSGSRFDLFGIKAGNA